MLKNITNDENFNNLVHDFLKINERGFIKGVSNNIFNSAGITLEHLLNKDPDSTFFPDYKDIEIKCKQRYSNYPIVLFSVVFEGPHLFETNYLCETYGFPLENNKNNELYANLRFKEKVQIYGGYYFELDIDEEKLFINIYDKDNIFLERTGFIYLDTIKSRMDIKLNKLAIIRASKRKLSGDLYFRYYKISCYLKKDFRFFIDAIKNNIIKVHIVERTGKTPNDKGKNRNKGASFEIYIENIETIFNLIYEFED